MVALGLTAIAAYVLMLVRALDSWQYNESGALLVLPFLLTIGIPVIVGVTRHDSQPLTRLILIAFVAKLAASLVRYQVITEVYESGDALAYHDKASVIAQSFRSGTITMLELLPTQRGTEFIDHLVAVIYVITGPTIIGGFLVMSFLGFWGLFLFYRAALIALPQLEHRRYALLLFFLPSLLFWPSSLGKEAWMLLALGVVAYGAARILTRSAGGYALFALGTWATFMARPHVAVIVFASMGVAYLLRRGGSVIPGTSTLVKIVGSVVLVAGLMFGIAAASDALKIGTAADESPSISAVLDETVRRTGQGDSSIEAVRVNSPLDYPQAVVNVMFRPFLWEARSATVLFSALESTVLVLLFVFGWRRITAIPRAALVHPYLAFAILFTILFVLAFSSIGNLGIIARQRTQVLPFVLLILAWPAAQTPLLDGSPAQPSFAGHRRPASV